MNPKLFISYGWTSQDYVNRVMKLAADLVSDGVDVIIDKWSLREGNDSIAFMESMVTDPAIQKVALLIDPTYTKKADARKGGVGTEAQIVTSKIYSEASQDKFVAVIMDRDEDGQAIPPVYYAKRIYIDLSDPASEAEQYEQLVRWVYGQPLHKKPPLGAKPRFLEEDDAKTNLGTASRARRALDAIRSGKGNSAPQLGEYLNALAESFEMLRLDPAKGIDAAKVRESVTAFKPYRDEFMGIADAVALYENTDERQLQIHRFFENILSFTDKPKNVSQWREGDFDNYRFIIHELYLCTIGIFLKRERFDAIPVLTSKFYSAGLAEDGRRPMVDLTAFMRELPNLEIENRSRNPQKVSPQGELLLNRADNGLCPKEAVMQADFFLFLYGRANGLWWYPHTGVYATMRNAPFEIFARAHSTRYFDRFKDLFKAIDRPNFVSFLDRLQEDRNNLPRYTFDSLPVVSLANRDQIATDD